MFYYFIPDGSQLFMLTLTILNIVSSLHVLKHFAYILEFQAYYKTYLYL